MHSPVRLRKWDKARDLPNWAISKPFPGHIDVYNHGSFLHKFRADKDVCVVLGREQKQCDVCVDEEGVASQHAAIVHSADGPVLMDIGGGSALRVNDKPIHNKHTLKFGDTFTLGDSSSLLFACMTGGPDRHGPSDITGNSDDEGCSSAESMQYRHSLPVTKISPPPPITGHTPHAAAVTPTTISSTAVTPPTATGSRSLKRSSRWGSEGSDVAAGKEAEKEKEKEREKEPAEKKSRWAQSSQFQQFKQFHLAQAHSGSSSGQLSPRQSSSRAPSMSDSASTAKASATPTTRFGFVSGGKIGGAQSKREDDTETTQKPTGKRQQIEDQWASVQLGDQNQTNKFLKLMGAMKPKNKAKIATPSQSASDAQKQTQQRNQAQLLAQIEQEYDGGRQRLGMRAAGLGFGS